MLQLPMLILVAALGQAPDEASWLDSVPAEADVVVRVRSVEAVRDDLVAMLKAMSPALSQVAEPALEQQVARFKNHFGEVAATVPFLSLVRVVAPEDPAKPPFAVIVKSSNYAGVLKSVAGGKAPTLKHEAGGYDSFDGPEGQTWYGAKGAGIVAFGPDKTLIAGFAKPGDKSLGKTLSAARKKPFESGDVGIYINAKALATRYADQIAQGKEQFMALLDQAGQQGGNAGIMESVKSIYGGMFDSLKKADVLTLNLDFAAEGLGVGGELTVRADSDSAKSVAKARTSDAAGIAKLPADSSYFVYMNLDATSFDKLMKMGLQMNAAAGKPTPEMEAAVAALRDHGPVEMLSATSIGNGIRSFGLSNVSDPKKFLASSEAALKAMKGSDSPLNFFKDVTFKRNVETYGGFAFSRIDMTIDYDKIAKMQQGNPAAGAAMKGMFGGDHITTWYGVSDKQLLQISAPTWEKAKAELDGYLKGEDRLGATAGYQAVRAKLPKQVSLLGLFSAQGLVRQIASQFSAISNNPDLKPPADLPKDPALIGASLTPVAPNGYEFHLVVPSPVGGVIENGLVPLVQGLQGRANP